MRKIITLIFVICATLYMGCLVIFLSFFSVSKNYLHKIARIWAGSIVFVSGVKVRVYGKKRMDAKTSYIIMSNHTSHFDIPVLLGKLDMQFRWVAKKELFAIPVFGPAMEKVGYIKIDRSNRSAAIKSLKRAKEMLATGFSVHIFPEGTRSPDGEMRDFKKGGFMLALETGAPILPVIITGTHGVLPKYRIGIDPKPVFVEILSPIETKDYSSRNKEELMRTVHGCMKQGIADLRRKTDR